MQVDIVSGILYGDIVAFRVSWNRRYIRKIGTFRFAIIATTHPLWIYFE